MTEESQVYFAAKRQIVEERLRLRDLDCEIPVDRWMGSSAAIYCHKSATVVGHVRTNSGRLIFLVMCDEHAKAYRAGGYATEFTPIRDAEKINLTGTGSAYGHLQWDWVSPNPSISTDVETSDSSENPNPITRR